MKKIGILHGKERSFPTALIARINAMNEPGVTAEEVLINQVRQGEPTPYAVILDRISQDVPFYRAYLKNAALNGTAVVNNPFWWSADEKFFNNCLATKLGVAVPKTVILPSKDMPADCSAESFGNLAYPLDWDGIFEHIGWPAYFKPHSGGGWKNVYKVRNREEFFKAYDETNQLVMLLQSEVHFDDYYRCYCIGGTDVRIMPYEPRNAHHLRYVVDRPPGSPELLARIERDVLTLNHALGYEFNTVEFGVSGGVPYAIDFCNPAPDADLKSVGEDNFKWVVEAAAKMLVRKAKANVPAQNNTVWGSYVQGAVKTGAPAARQNNPMCATRKKHKFTLGIEEEFQIVDPVTRELKSHIEEIIEGGKIILKERVRPELHQSVVEVGTDICEDIAAARKSVTGLRRDLAGLAQKANLRIAAAGTHPFSHWIDQKISAGERYQGVLNDLQQVARANLIFGLHVHVGMPDRETAIQLQNTARYFLPHIFALSTNSPFWVGRNTGFASYRLQIFQRFPRTGIPDLFDSVEEFDGYVNLLIKTGCIDNAKKIWWDIRLHPLFHTLEFRVCDIPMRVDETICLAAIMQAVIAKLYKLHRKNLGFRTYRARLINENRWRASRYGINGKMIDFGKQEEVPTRDLINELLEFIDDVVDELGSRPEVNYVQQILANGTGADRQVAVYNQTKDLKQVVDYIINETHHGLDL